MWLTIDSNCPHNSPNVLPVVSTQLVWLIEYPSDTDTLQTLGNTIALVSHMTAPVKALYPSLSINETKVDLSSTTSGLDLVDANTWQQLIKMSTCWGVDISTDEEDAYSVLHDDDTDEDTLGSEIHATGSNHMSLYYGHCTLSRYISEHMNGHELNTGWITDEIYIHLFMYLQ